MVRAVYPRFSRDDVNRVLLDSGGTALQVTNGERMRAPRAADVVHWLLGVPGSGRCVTTSIEVGMKVTD
jgi:hypothetical protein